MAMQAETLPTDLKISTEPVTENPATPSPVELSDDEKREALKIAEEEKRSSGAGKQKRIDKLTRQLREAEEALVAERNSRAKIAIPTAEVAPKTEQEPREEDFTNYKEFVKAQAQWEIKQALKNIEQEEEKAVENEHAQQVVTEYNSKLETAREKYADFDEVAQTTASIEFADANASKSFQVCVMEAENGPEVIYYLAKHPDEVSRFKEMNPAKIALAVGRISAKLEAENAGEQKTEAEGQKMASVETKTVAQPKPASRAPAPIAPLGGNSRGEKPLAELDVDEYVRVRNEQLRKQGRR